jgi:hypothetical protein
MALLSERQKIAERLTRELQALGATVTSVLPLRDDARLRFSVLDAARPKVLQELADGGWQVVFAGTNPSFFHPDGTMRLASIFEINIPHERQSIIDDRKTIPRNEIGPRKKTDTEVKAVLKYLGWDNT